ncbi:MAG: site-specific integrase [Candidatus Eremiobacteraeota bacterium]|nr:site-specific integrase [Candidatus Eremiobacteraeota bacterium]
MRARTASEITRKRAPTVLEFAEGWLEREVKPNRRATTYRSYKGILDNHILPTLGAMRINRLEPADVERCIAIVRTTSTASMASKSRTVLHRIMARAVALEIASRNPVTPVAVPRVDKRPMAFLDSEQLTKLFAAAEGDRFEALPIVLATAGLRIGEALALTWNDVDLNERLLSVTKTAQEGDGVIKVVQPKTAAGRRVVAIGAAAAKALRKRHRLAEREKLAAPENIVFPTETGTHMRLSNLHRRWWSPLLAKAQLERIRLHDLRHSSASLSLLAGTSAKVVAEKLGHTNPGFTLRTYSHSVESLARVDADAIDHLIRPRSRKAALRKSPARN